MCTIINLRSTHHGNTQEQTTKFEGKGGHINLKNHLNNEAIEVEICVPVKY